MPHTKISIPEGEALQAATKAEGWEYMGGSGIECGHGGSELWSATYQKGISRRYFDFTRFPDGSGHCRHYLT
jgi:hypothetical protein